MITAKEAAEKMQTATDVLNGITPDQWDTALERMAADRLRIASDHAANLAHAKAEQDRMNTENAAYITREWKKNHPPEPERVMPWRLSRDDMAELRLWWDWKQLDDDVKLEMPPPPCPSEMAQAFMDTNPAWKFRRDGTLVASIVENAFLNATPRLDRVNAIAARFTVYVGSVVAGVLFAVFLSPFIMSFFHV